MQPGGHVEPGEWPVDAALREAVEETGLARLSLHSWHSNNPFPIDISIHQIPADAETDEPTHWHYDMRYLVESANEGPVTLRLGEVTGYRWVPLSDEGEGAIPEGLSLAASKAVRVCRGGL